LTFIARNQDQIKELDAQKEMLLKQRDELLAERLKHIAHIDQCTAHIQKQDSERETLLTEHHEQVSYIRECQQHIAEQDAEISKLQKQKQEQAQQISALEKAGNKQHDELATVRAVLKETESLCRELQQELDRLHALKTYKLFNKLNLMK
jgi:chromosome segregation ATPase